MKHILFLLLLGSFAKPACAQFQVSDAEIPSFNSSGALRRNTMETFLKSTTVFVIQPRDKPLQADFEKSLASIWTVTPFKVVSAEEMGRYRGAAYSLFTFGGYTVQMRSSSGMVTSRTHILYDLTIPEYNKKGEIKDRTLMARFVLSPDFKTVTTMSQQGAWFEGRRNREERETNQSIQLNVRGLYNNWGPGQIRGYVKAVNDHLAEGKVRAVFNEVRLKEPMKALQHDTLYLPDYLKERFRPVVAGFSLFAGTGSGRDDDDMDERDVSKAYPFPYRFVTPEELDQMIVNGSKPVYHVRGRKINCVRVGIW